MRHRVARIGSFNAVYAAMLMLFLHWAIVLYVNSTYLAQFVSGEAIGALYTIGSALTLITFLIIARVLRRLGNYKLTLGLAFAEIVVLLGLAAADSLRVAIPLFVLHQAIVPLLLFNLDVFTEKLIGPNEGITGGTRGLVLTIMSIAGAVAPLAAGFLVQEDAARPFTYVYLASAGFMLLFSYGIVQNFRAFSDAPYDQIRVFTAFRAFWVQRNIRYVFLAHFLLQLFFSWMVIYIPLYLASALHFTWGEIGTILFVALMAYVLFEYGIGVLADRYIGEQEMMGVGFLILAVTTSYIAYLDAPLLIPWMVTLFMTRVGAALVETTTESYFFKNTNASSADAISFIRASRPLAYIAGALLGSLTLLYFPFNYAFLILGLLMLPGIALALAIEDTR